MIGKQVVENNKSVLNNLAAIFGQDIISPTGKLRRKVLGRKAFVDEISRKKLNKIVHPYLLKELRKQVKANLKSQRNVVVDTALLIEWELEKELDFVIMVHASKISREKRALKRGFSKTDFKLIQKRQMAFTEYRQKVDCLIYNNSSENKLYRKLDKLIKKLPL